MSCAACASSVESIVGAVEGVSLASVNFAANTLMVEYDDEKTSVDIIVNAAGNIGYTLIEDIGISIEQEEKKQEQKLMAMRYRLIGSFVFFGAGICILNVFASLALQHLSASYIVFACGALVWQRLLYTRG